MKQTTTLLLFLLFAAQLSAQRVIGFESFDLPQDTFLNALAMEDRGTSSPYDTIFVVDSFEFPSTIFPSEQYGDCWCGGWGISTITDTTNKSYTNLGAANPGMGAEGSATYVVGQRGAYINLPENVYFSGFDFTNTAYAADVIENGNSFSRAFGTDSTGATGVADSFILRVYMYKNSVLQDSLSVPLADYRFADDSEDYIVTGWRSMDLIDAVETDSIGFCMVSSDVGPYGINTPTFFALDNLRYSFGPSDLQELAVKAPLRQYPNPASDYAHFGERTGETGQLYLTDMSGRVLIQRNGYAEGSRVDLSQLPRGSYFAVLRSADNDLSVSKLILQ